MLAYVQWRHVSFNKYTSRSAWLVERYATTTRNDYCFMCVVFVETSNTGMSTNSPRFPLSPPLIEKTALKCPSNDKQITDRQTDRRTLNNTDWQWHHSKAPPNCVRADYSLLTPKTAKRRTSRTDHWNSLPTSLSTCRRIYSLRLTDRARRAGFNVSTNTV